MKKPMKKPMKKYRRFPGWGCQVCALRLTGHYLEGLANPCFEKHKALGKRPPCKSEIVMIPINCLLPDYNASDFPIRRAWYAEE